MKLNRKTTAALALAALLILVLALYLFNRAPQKLAEGEEEHGAQEVELSDAQIEAANIELATAAPGELHDWLRLNGIIQANQETTVQITPRFPGIVKEINKRIGDHVAKGDLLATVESNQSLTAYALKTPIAGTVIERQAALGEYVSEQKPVFTIADLADVWVDFQIYRRDFARVQVGDTAEIDPEDGSPPIETKIAYVSPVGASDTQSALARAVVRNNNRLRPGLFVVGRVQLTTKPAEVIAKASALQTVEGKTMIFVRDGEHFEAREVEVGRRDPDHVEILSGLKAGEVYAAKNSFVIKAEMAKGSASHDH